ncbi:hypothetical protein ACQP1U_06885 [Actinomycetota bacterium]
MTRTDTGGGLAGRAVVIQWRARTTGSVWSTSATVTSDSTGRWSYVRRGASSNLYYRAYVLHHWIYASGYSPTITGWVRPKVTLTRISPASPHVTVMGNAVLMAGTVSPTASTFRFRLQELGDYGMWLDRAAVAPNASGYWQATYTSPGGGSGRTTYRVLLTTNTGTYAGAITPTTTITFQDPTTWRVEPAGSGLWRIGMTAAAADGALLRTAQSRAVYASTQTETVQRWGTGGLLALLTRAPALRTATGIHVGSTRSQVQAAYPSLVELPNVCSNGSTDPYNHDYAVFDGAGRAMVFDFPAEIPSGCVDGDSTIVEQIELVAGRSAADVQRW